MQEHKEPEAQWYFDFTKTTVSFGEKKKTEKTDSNTGMREGNRKIFLLLYTSKNT